MRILVVDDDAVSSKIIALVLRRADFEVEIAECGLKAVAMWEKGDYDLVLMDVQMPHMNGFEATRLIREKEEASGEHTPIVAITAYALRKDEEQCRAAGMDAYISKPVDFKKFFETIRGLIGTT